MPIKAEVTTASLSLIDPPGREAQDTAQSGAGGRRRLAPQGSDTVIPGGSHLCPRARMYRCLRHLDPIGAHLLLQLLPELHPSRFQHGIRDSRDPAVRKAITRPCRLSVGPDA